MLQITGQVVNLFTLDAGKDKDGKEYAERYKVQLMGNVALPNGDAKFDLMDLTVESLDDWTSLQSKQMLLILGLLHQLRGISFTLCGRVQSLEWFPKPCKNNR
jgi:hypothetical protein